MRRQADNQPGAGQEEVPGGIFRLVVAVDTGQDRAADIHQAVEHNRDIRAADKAVAPGTHPAPVEGLVLVAEAEAL